MKKKRLLSMDPPQNEIINVWVNLISELRDFKQCHFSPMLLISLEHLSLCAIKCSKSFLCYRLFLF